MKTFNLNPIENGPVIVSDDAGTKVAICRCGKSKNGITCDGSHAQKDD